MKLREYLYQGKLVVSVNLPEVRKLERFCISATTKRIL
jgi:hypothetical protein